MASVLDLAQALRATPLGVLARGTARAPLEAQAGRLIAALPRVELVELTGPLTFEATLAVADSRHAWSLGAAEQLVLQALIKGRGVRTVFEIGTFNGGTTRVIAEALPEEGRVVTLDLPVAAFDATQSPKDFTGAQVGRAYNGSPAEHKITQIDADSLTFDVSPYRGQFDLVLVDGGHEYRHGVADTRTALALAAPGGVVLWDDFQPYWHGLVRGICQAMQGRTLGQLAGTALGVHVAPAGA